MAVENVQSLIPLPLLFTWLIGFLPLKNQLNSRVFSESESVTCTCDIFPLFFVFLSFGMLIQHLTLTSIALQISFGVPVGT